MTWMRGVMRGSLVPVRMRGRSRRHKKGIIPTIPAGKDRSGSLGAGLRCPLSAPVRRPKRGGLIGDDDIRHEAQFASPAVLPPAMQTPGQFHIGRKPSLFIWDLTDSRVRADGRSIGAPMTSPSHRQQRNGLAENIFFFSSVLSAAHPGWAGTLACLARGVGRRLVQWAGGDQKELPTRVSAAPPSSAKRR